MRQSKNHQKVKKLDYILNISKITPPTKKLMIEIAKNRNINQKVANWGPRQGYAQWQNNQGSQKGSMPGKPNLLISI